MPSQLSLIGRQKDDDAVKEIQYYERLALEFDPRGYCVCTSEGKDSTVLGHLYRRAGVKHFYARSITGIDPPELVYHARKQAQARRDEGYIYYDMMYEKSMWQLMEQKLFPPLRQIRYCCPEFKEKRHELTNGCLMSMGVRKYESVKRKARRNNLEIVANGRRGNNIILPFDNGENRRVFESCYIDCEKRLNPIVYWEDADVWDYHHENKLPYCCLYDEGFDRLGCIGCPQARECARKREFASWPGFKKLYIRTFDCMIERRKQKGLPCFGNAGGTGEEWFEWWITDAAQEKPVAEGQMGLDEGGINYAG